MNVITIVKIFFCVMLLNACALNQSQNHGKPTQLKLFDQSEISTSQLREFLDNKMIELDIPGLSFALINDADIVFIYNHGKANIETGELVTDNSIFEAASLSKPVFAFFTLQLLERSAIDLSRPLHFYLKEESMEVDIPIFRAKLYFQTRIILAMCFSSIQKREMNLTGA